MFIRVLIFCLSAIGIAGVVSASPGRYLTTEQFLAEVFDGVAAKPSRVVINAELRQEAERVLGHAFPRIRIRYWDGGDTTAWILDEIGKTEPITLGISVQNGHIGSVRVLEFRESRGYEVRYPFFTDQFRGAKLNASMALDTSIDGITGATLSVRAVDRVARLALLLDAYVKTLGETSAQENS